MDGASLAGGTGHGADRLIRALQRGGMAVAAPGGSWAIYRDRDRRRRIVGTLDGVAVEALRSTGSLCPLGTDTATLVWTGPAPRASDPVPAPAPLPVEAGSPARRPHRSAMVQVLDTLEDPDAAVRARNAALRFNGDIHRAASPQSVTMRWDAAGAVDGSRGTGGAGMGQSALAAARRLSRIRAALGETGSAALIALILHERPLARIAADAGWSAAAAPARLAALLLDLADAYDRVTR